MIHTITDTAGTKLTGAIVAGAPEHCIALRVTKGRKAFVGKTVLIARASIVKMVQV